MVSNVILIDDDKEDGIPLYSPFTGIPYFYEDGPDFDPDGRHRDPSLVFCYIGQIGDFHFIRPDAEEIVSAAFYDESDDESDDESREEQSSGKKVGKRNGDHDMVKELIRIAESISTRLKTERNLNTLTFVQTGGYNGMIVSCFEQGYLSDGEWCPLRCK